MIDSPPSAIEERYHGALGEYFDVTEGYFVRRYLPQAGALTLDLGCGTGRFLPVFATESIRVIGIDLLYSDLRVAEAKNVTLAAEGLFVRGDASCLPLPTGSTDFVIAMGIFQSMTDLGPFLRELARVTKPAARIVFTVWNSDARGVPRQFSIDAQQKTHRLRDVAATLSANGFTLEAAETTFYIPRRLLWLGYRLSRVIRLSDLYTRFAILLESVLHRRFGQRGCGWQYLIAAQRGNLE